MSEKLRPCPFCGSSGEPTIEDAQAARIAELESDYAECMRQYDHQQERACNAEARIAELEKTIATLREELDNDDEMVKDYALQVIRLQAQLTAQREVEQ